ITGQRNLAPRKHVLPLKNKATLNNAAPLTNVAPGRPRPGPGTIRGTYLLQAARGPAYPIPNVHPSQTTSRLSGKLPAMTSQTLASTLEGFLAGGAGAVVIEDGEVVFDLGHAKYSVSGENNKCLVHFWSEERNFVRRVLDLQTEGEVMRVTVQKMGQASPTRLDICRDRDPRSASSKRTARAAYQRVLERVL